MAQVDSPSDRMASTSASLHVRAGTAHFGERALACLFNPPNRLFFRGCFTISPFFSPASDVHVRTASPNLLMDRFG